MTIETRIAKNGSKRYYVRDENGKLKAISYKDAMMYQRQNERVQKWLATIARESQIAAIDDYAVTVEAQEVAIETETELASTETKAEVVANVEVENNVEEVKVETKPEVVEVKNDRITELKAKSKMLWKKFLASLQGYYVNFNGNFFSTDYAPDFTTFLNDKYDWLYRKDENGEYVKIESGEFDKINRIEIELDDINQAINEEIARNAVKFVAGKWYTDSEGCKYLILKRTAKTVTVYNQDQDDWNALKSYDANDEIDGEFDCIFRKKIQFDERGEYVDWEDEDGELVQVFAKNETEPPTDDDDNNDGNDDDDNEEVEAENNVKEVKAETESKNEVKEDEPKFEASKTYYINDENGKPYTLKVESRTAKYLVGTTANGTNKYYVHNTFRGEYVDAKLTDEFGNREVIWAAHEYKPEVKADELSEELIDEYIISDEAQTEALHTELANVERAKGNCNLNINGEHVFFENNQITRINAANKLGMLFTRINGKKHFFTVATQCGYVIHGSTKAIAASKVADRYMAKETAKEQDKFFHNFFDAHKTEMGKFFTVITEIVYADGYDHTFERQFDYFNQAQEFVGAVKKVTGDNPTQIIIKRNQQCGHWFYHLDKNGTEHDNKPETLFFQIFSKDIQGRIDELNKAIADNTDFAKTMSNDYDTYQNLSTATSNLAQTRDYYEFIAHENEPCTTEEEVNQLKPADNKPTEIERIEKRMSEITKERDELYDALEEAEADDEIAQQWIDYLEEELEILLVEYNELGARLAKLKVQNNVA